MSGNGIVDLAVERISGAPTNLNTSLASSLAWFIPGPAGTLLAVASALADLIKSGTITRISGWSSKAEPPTPAEQQWRSDMINKKPDYFFPTHETQGSAGDQGGGEYQVELPPPTQEELRAFLDKEVRDNPFFAATVRPPAKPVQPVPQPVQPIQVTSNTVVPPPVLPRAPLPPQPPLVREYDALNATLDDVVPVFLDRLAPLARNAPAWVKPPVLPGFDNPIKQRLWDQFRGVPKAQPAPAPIPAPAPAPAPAPNGNTPSSTKECVNLCQPVCQPAKEKPAPKPQKPRIRVTLSAAEICGVLSQRENLKCPCSAPVATKPRRQKPAAKPAKPPQKPVPQRRNPVQRR